MASTDIADGAQLHGIDYPRGVDTRTPVKPRTQNLERMIDRLSVCGDPPHWR